MLTNSSNNPNSFLKAFYSDMFLVRGSAIFAGSHDGTDHIIGTYAWWDSAFVTHSPIPLPKHTKKASVRVMVREGVFAPKHPAFVDMSGNIGFDYDEEGDGYTLNMPTNPPGIALMDGSEIEVYGIDQIKKLIFFNNKNRVVGEDITPYNADAVYFLLNITLFK